MFEFLDELNHEDGSAKRYEERVKLHTDTYGSRRRHHFWWFVHNCIAHPLIGICPVRWTFDFHDYTSRKINLRDFND